VLTDWPTKGAARYLTDALGIGFTCLVFSRAGSVPQAVADFARAAGEAVKPVLVGRQASDADGSLARAYDATDGAVVLVRPDGHVAGRWRRPDRATLQGALSRAGGGTPSHRR
jgi:3-(3-hydroxy-phenyl)propionate hydroxylase